ncbi:MAG: TonB-dependent receptor [Bacteroidales bacterium]|nr:TonB-dependent receptor [Bacteroidales bacterium]
MRNITLLLLFLLLGISFRSVSQVDTLTENAVYPLPSFNLSETELEGYGENQDVSGLLMSSRDIFESTAGYTFGPARYRIRGYDTENTSVLINGIKVNDIGSGRAYWGSWGGLNDALRNQSIYTGINASNLTFGGIGGVTNITTRASAYGKGLKVTYSSANRSYRNRIMVLYSTGMMESGWALTVSGSRRWAEEGYVKGTFYDAWSYFISAEKKINSKHSIGLIGYGSPNKRGRTGIAVQEANDLVNDNHYNPYWGFQNGEVRNARIGNYHQPMIMLSHYWTMSSKTSLTSTLYYNFGKGGSTALNWTETGDPRPDYYRNLPSYSLEGGDMEQYEYRTRMWQENEVFRQINWDHMYFANSKFLNTIYNVDGIDGNNITAYRSKYIIEDRRNDKSQIGFNMNVKSELNKHLNLAGGLELVWYKGFHFNKIVDLLGGEFWLDVDKYADQVGTYTYSDESQNDLRTPNRLVKVGDRFGHDYTSNVNTYNGFAQAEFTYSKFDFYVAGNLSFSEFWRTGNMQNGKFPENSLGDSEKKQFTNYGVKGGLVFKIDGRNFISANGEYSTRAPFFRNSYISPRTRDYTVTNLVSEKILSGDINYRFRASWMKARLSLYYSKFTDQTWSRSFYHDDLNTFVNYAMTGVDKVHAGMELGVKINITTSLVATAVYGRGQFIYDSRPLVTITEDNSADVLAEDRVVYLENYYVGGMPQTVGSVGLKYNSQKYWWLGVNFNYFGDIYLDINPDRRTAEALAGYAQDDYRIEKILDQEKLPDGFTMDLFAGKSWRVNKKYYIGLSLNVSNLLNTRDLAIGGFEQLRYDHENIDRFPPKYIYLFGTQYFLNINFRM